MGPELLFTSNSRKSPGANSHWSSLGPCPPLSQSLWPDDEEFEGRGAASLGHVPLSGAGHRERSLTGQMKIRGIYLLAGHGDSGKDRGRLRTPGKEASIVT